MQVLIYIDCMLCIVCFSQSIFPDQLWHWHRSRGHNDDELRVTAAAAAAPGNPLDSCESACDTRS